MPFRKIARSIHVNARDVARKIAETAEYKQSRRESHRGQHFQDWNSLAFFLFLYWHDLDRIRATRAGDGMPIDQAARSCGVSVGMLSKLENGKG